MPVPRDARGWRVPSRGTRSYAIYTALVAGKSPAQIRDDIGGSLNAIRVLVWKIKNPRGANRAQAEWAFTNWHFKGGREKRRASGKVAA